MKKIFVFLVVTLIWTACGNSKESSETTVPIALLQDGVEVLSFHSKQRCPTCIAIENETRNLLNSSFAQQLADSTVVFEHYQVSFSSLILVKYDAGKPTVCDLTEYAFSKARVAPDEFKAELAGRLEALLQ